MRQVWMILSVCLAAALPGCEHTQQDLKPTIAEEYVLPPEGDARFGLPPQFPKETLNNGPVKRFTNPMQQGGPPRGPGRMGGAGGMGGGGY